MVDNTWRLSVVCICSQLLLVELSSDTTNSDVACIMTNHRILFEQFLSDDTCISSGSRFLHTSLGTWAFSTKQRLFDTFPIDKEQRNYVREVPHALFSVVYPVPLRSDLLLAAVSVPVLEDILDLNPSITKTTGFVKFASGNLVLQGPKPLSHRYGGHQFGHWADQLGDGRAVMLGEYVNQKGELWELQLKGSGLTPYSRRGDGRAVIRSSVREFLCSEAMEGLGIPTSRAASLVISSDPVIRDQFYDGHPQTERAAVVLRLAKSWFRIGSLEILTKNNEIDLLRQLTDFVIVNYFPSINDTAEGKYLSLLAEIVRQTADLIARWQSVGFTHGVCNTDNFSLLSITIDYGPFAFMEGYDPDFVPNTSDDEGRYSYQNQPNVGVFNLEKLRQALKPLLTNDQVEQTETILKSYAGVYKTKFMELFRKKLGLTFEYDEDDEQLVAILLKMMEDKKADFTMVFGELSESTLKDIETFSNRSKIPDALWALRKLSSHKWFVHWIKVYVKRSYTEIQSEKERQTTMQKTNPRYILRNWIAQKVISQVENDDFEMLHNVLEVMINPFIRNPWAETEGFASKPPSWAKYLKVSCSS